MLLLDSLTHTHTSPINLEKQIYKFRKSGKGQAALPVFKSHSMKTLGHSVLSFSVKLDLPGIFSFMPLRVAPSGCNVAFSLFDDLDQLTMSLRAEVFLEHYNSIFY